LHQSAIHLGVIESVHGQQIWTLEIVCKLMQPYRQSD